MTLRHQKTWPREEVCANFPVIRVGGWYRRGGTLRVGRLGHILVDLLLFLALWRLRRSYDLIHTLQLSPLAVVATIIGKIIQKPVIVGVQNTGPDQLASFSLEGGQMCANDYKEESTCSQAVQMQVESGGDIAALQEYAWGGHWMLNYLRKSEAYYQILSSRSYTYLIAHGFRPERLVHIPNGVDIQQFYPVFWQREPLTEEHERAVLCVARLEYAKGIDVLLHAWAYMLKLPADWRATLHPRLFLAGDGARRAELEDLATELGIRESVEFLGTRHDIVQLLQHAWCFVLPSRWEGMPNALLEAMACGLPCIASRVSGSEDIIEQGRNGLLVEPEQPEKLAYALRLLIENADLACKLGGRGYETMLTHYQLSSIVQSCLTFYDYLLTRNACKRRVVRSMQNIRSCSGRWQDDE